MRRQLINLYSQLILGQIRRRYSLLFSKISSCKTLCIISLREWDNVLDFRQVLTRFIRNSPCLSPNFS